MRRTSAVVLLSGALLASCSSGPTPNARAVRPGPAATFDSGSIRQTVLLVGDAGAARRDDAVLVALRRMANEAPLKTLVVFLGDNLYEAGLPSGDGPDVEPFKNVLRAQLRAAGSARALFVAGNHDWGKYRNSSTAWSHGRDAVVRQAAFIARESGGRASFLPTAGCAGPAEFLFENAPDALRVLAIDSQWWLTALKLPPPIADGASRASRDSGCTASTTDEAARELQRMIAAEPERATIVVAHHPLASNGKHGHPILGWPFNVQDLPNRRNARFRTALADMGVVPRVQRTWRALHARVRRRERSEGRTIQGPPRLTARARNWAGVRAPRRAARRAHRDSPRVRPRWQRADARVRVDCASGAGGAELRLKR